MYDTCWAICTTHEKNEITLEKHRFHKYEYNKIFKKNYDIRTSAKQEKKCQEKEWDSHVFIRRPSLKGKEIEIF